MIVEVASGNGLELKLVREPGKGSDPLGIAFDQVVHQLDKGVASAEPGREQGCCFERLIEAAGIDQAVKLSPAAAGEGNKPAYHLRERRDPERHRHESWNDAPR